MKNLKIYLIFMVLVLVVIVAYSLGISNKPVADDFDRPEAYLKWTPKARFLPLLALLKLGLEKTFQLQSYNPEPYHIASIVVHITITLMVFILYKVALNSELFAFIGALIFAIYPRHHESIFRFMAILHPLMTFYFLISLLLYNMFISNSRKLWLTLSAISFLLAVFSSEAAIAGLGIVCCFNLIKNYPKNYNIRQFVVLLKSVWPFILIISVYVLMLAIKGNVSLSNSRTHYYARLGMDVLRDLIGYLSYSLFFFIPLRQIHHIYLKIAIALVTFAVLMMLWARGSHWSRFGIVWTVFSFIIYAIGSPFGNADRYFYFPSIGLSLIVADVTLNIYKQFGQKLNINKQYIILGVLMLCVGVYAIFSIHTLWRRAAEWRQAGEIAAQILNQVYAKHPKVKPGTTFYFWGLPAQYGQAQVLFTGVEGALVAHYNQSNLHAYVIYDLDILKLVKKYGCSVSLYEESAIYIYVFQDNKLVDCSDAYHAPAVRDSLKALSQILVP